MGRGRVEKAMKAGTGNLGIAASGPDMRRQRAALLLREVGYIIGAHFDVVPARATPPSTWTSSTVAPGVAPASLVPILVAGNLQPTLHFLKTTAPFLSRTKPCAANATSAGCCATWISPPTIFRIAGEQTYLYELIVKPVVTLAPSQVPTRQTNLLRHPTPRICPSGSG